MPERGPDLAQGDAGRGRRPHAGEHGVPRAGVGSHDYGAHFVRREPAGQRALGLRLTGRELQPAADRADPLGRLAESVEPASGPVGRPRRPPGADDLALGRRLGEHWQLSAPSQLSREVHHLEAETKVGLVGAVPGQGVSEREARVWGGRPFAGQLADEPAEQSLHLAKNIFLGGERHLEVDLVELAGAAVGPRCFIPETRGDLEIAFDPPDHQQLLELLGCLGKGVKLTGVEPAGHEVVAGAFGRGSREHRCLDLEEPTLREVGPDQLAKTGPLGQALGQWPSSHVQVAVVKPCLLADLRVPFDREGKHLRR